MTRAQRRDQTQTLLSHSTNGVIRVLRLAELGVPANTAYRRCGLDGPWRRLLPGVVCLHNGPPTREQQVSAALLYAGPDAVATGLEACRQHGLRKTGETDGTGGTGTDGVVHLLVPADRKVHSNGFAVVERTTRMPPAVVRGGTPLAPTTRAVLDACRRITTLAPCRALLAEAVQRRFTTPDKLRAELARGSQRGSAIPRKALAEISEGAHSVAEIDAYGVWQRSQLPVPAWNGRLVGPDGEYIATPDAWFDDVALAWEIDSRQYHSDPDGYAATMARNTRYATHGVVLLQSLPARVRDEPEAVARELRAAYAAAAARPRPDVTHHPVG
ncbi:hypothetical protein SAMN06265360_10261 [Haloechinothrix alba]|uniref:Transcriptional regulator, AbiEi antitoxin, Type IV TA system n=1 Tax=Haloechinothrix alba TaxID=664784 RepID=A0A238VDC2_9PSEU|nr:hypothetical protein [Haloechinothrix alba]SNR32037.1 hypothetical protein SAMN06265360_10261 [Haloechinothrix alba]